MKVLTIALLWTMLTCVMAVETVEADPFGDDCRLLHPDEVVEDPPGAAMSCIPRHPPT